MSGALSPEVAMAASAAAHVAKAAAHGMPLPAYVRQRAEAAFRRDSNAGRTWREMERCVRVAIVGLAIDTQGRDPMELAVQPWAAFSEDERRSLGSVARLVNKQTARAADLR